MHKTHRTTELQFNNVYILVNNNIHDTQKPSNGIESKMCIEQVRQTHIYTLPEDKTQRQRDRHA